MGKRGTKPLPTNLKIIKGTLQKSRQKKNAVKAELLKRMPSPPDWLSDKSKIEWALQIKELDKMGILAEADLTVFAMYCYYVGEFQKQTDRMKNSVPSNKNLQLFYFIQSLSKEASKLATQFGFTPSSRTGISITPKEKEDPIQSLMNKVK